MHSRSCRSEALVGSPGGNGSGEHTGAAYIFVRSAGVWNEYQKLTAADAATGDRFGGSVALASGTALIGAERDDDAGTSSGSAYVFVEDGGVWVDQQKLAAGDAAAGSYFGRSVALAGETALVGAPQGDGTVPGSGSAYLFARIGGVWSQQGKLSASDGAVGDAFGEAVALSGDMASVGAPHDGDAGSWSGSAYLFARDDGGWSEVGKLGASDAAEGDRFGSSVSLSAATALVGAPSEDEAGDIAGAAYSFVSSGGPWSQEQKLMGVANAAGDLFGYPAAVEGDTVLVGSTGDDEAGLDAGAVYVFERHGGVWVEHQKLMASDAATGDGFGWAAFSGDTALIGAGGNDETGLDAGAVYVFGRKDGIWLEEQKLTASDPQPGSSFGLVSMSGDRAALLAIRGSCATALSGVAYLLERRNGLWSERYTLCASDGTPSQGFGLLELAISGDTVALGAFGDDDDGWRSGAVYLFNTPLFEDGFESGDTTAWALILP